MVVSLLFLLLVSVLAIPGGWTPQNPNDPRYMNIAQLATAQLNEQNNGDTNYAPVQILCASTQVVAGINYKTVFTAAQSNCNVTQERSYSNCGSPDAAQQYEAVAWLEPGQTVYSKVTVTPTTSSSCQ